MLGRVRPRREQDQFRVQTHEIFFEIEDGDSEICSCQDSAFESRLLKKRKGGVPLCAAEEISRMSGLGQGKFNLTFSAVKDCNSALKPRSSASSSLRPALTSFSSRSVISSLCRRSAFSSTSLAKTASESARFRSWTRIHSEWSALS